MKQKRLRNILRALLLLSSLSLMFLLLFNDSFRSNAINYMTFLGYDENSNGVRDDVDLWVDEYSDNNSDVKKAFLKMAGLHHLLLRNTFSNEKYRVHLQEMVNARNCVMFFYILDHGKRVEDSVLHKSGLLVEKIYNTPLRKLYRFLGSSNITDELRDLSYRAPSAIERIKSCSFKIMKLRNYISMFKKYRPDSQINYLDPSVIDDVIYENSKKK